MRYNTIKFNDSANVPGIAVSVYLQGCHHHCKNCFNPETWDFGKGQEFTQETLDSIINGLTKNGINRSLCLLGGDPLALENLPLTQYIITMVKEKLPQTKIYIWSGYTYEQLSSTPSLKLLYILNQADFLIDGLYVEELRDISLPMRGSSNQRIWDLKNKIDITEKI